MILWLVGMIPLLRGNALFWLGIGTNLLLLPSVIVFFRMGFPAAFAALAAMGYGGIWWMLVNSRSIGR